MYAGGLSYFSSGSVRSGVRVEVCAEAVASEARKARQIKRLVAEAVDDLISGASLKRCRLRRAQGSDSRFTNPDLEPPRRRASLSPGQQSCREIFREYLV